MGHLCLNDMFGYCNGEPKQGETTTTSILGIGNGCTREKDKCNHFVSAKAKDAVAMASYKPPKKGK